MLAVSLLIHANFSSELMITWLQTIRSVTFDPPSNRNGSKAKFWTNWNRVITNCSKFCIWSNSNDLKMGQKRNFEQIESHESCDMIIYLEKQFEWIKSETACMCHVTTSFIFFTGSKVYGQKSKWRLLVQFLEMFFGKRNYTFFFWYWLAFLTRLTW